MIAEVALNIPLERTFHYLVPAELESALQPGMRVLVPFGPRLRIGFVLSLPSRSPIEDLKPIRRLIDPAPVIEAERWKLAAWLSEYYYCSLGEALSAMVPSGLRLKAAPSADEPSANSGRGSPHILTAHQEQALREILAAMESRRASAILLEGVTGSGKTELYLRAIERALKEGRSAISLIPEIALTPQMIERFHERLGDTVAVWHSRLSARERSKEWQRFSEGSRRVVIGARSAIFAPIKRLGLVILDEEQEATYKQQDTPRYHAREVAAERARLSQATLILGSATPSIESRYAALQRGGRRLHLPERVRGRSLPDVEIIDMRDSGSGRFRAGALSLRLESALQETVERKEQAMLLLNRRGFARVAQCKSCGEVRRCRSCSVPLVYHASRRALICHYCNFEEEMEELCRLCRKGFIRLRGSGTERVESELHRLFPATSIGRMDRDTTKSREAHREIYESIKSHATTLLIGTQMIAKGLDFPKVTLVGIVSADTALNLPDFRAGERTFDLLTQMAGRAGRGEEPGRVLIQTYCPDHYAIEAVRKHDYQRFYEEEIRMRRRLLLPPFVHLIELILMGSSAKRAQDQAEKLSASLRQAIGRRRMGLLGPAPHRIPRLRRTYRFSLLLKGRSVEAMTQLLRKVLSPGRRFHGMPVIVDVDPL